MVIWPHLFFVMLHSRFAELLLNAIPSRLFTVKRSFFYRLRNLKQTQFSAFKTGRYLLAFLKQ